MRSELNENILAEEMEIDQEMAQTDQLGQDGAVDESRRDFMKRALGLIGVAVLGLEGCKKTKSARVLARECKNGKDAENRDVDLKIEKNNDLERKLAPLIQKFTNIYENDPSAKAAWEAGFNRLGPFHSEFRQILKSKCVPDELIAQLMVESRIQNGVRSWAGAHGIAQIMPETATKDLGMTISNGMEVQDDSFTVMQVRRRQKVDGKTQMVLGNYPERNYYDERDNPFSSVKAMGEYMQRLHRQFGDWHMAICAYNCGPGLMSKRLRLIEKRTGKKPTMVDYVDYLQKRIVQKKCRAASENLHYIVKFLAINPKLQQWRKDKLSAYPQEDVDGRKVGYAEPTVKYPHGREYTVKSGDCLSVIAGKVEASVRALRKANPDSLRRGSKIYPGQKLNLPGVKEQGAKITPEDIREGINKLHPKEQLSIADFYGKYNPHAANPYRVYLPNHVNEDQLDGKTKRILRRARRRKVLKESEYREVVQFNLKNQPGLPADYPIYLPKKYIPSLEKVLEGLKSKKTHID